MNCNSKSGIVPPAVMYMLYSACYLSSVFTSVKETPNLSGFPTENPHDVSIIVFLLLQTSAMAFKQKVKK